MLWITLDKYSGIFLSIIVSMALARLLSPSEFGLVALVSVLLSFISILSGMGLGPAIIQAKHLEQNDINSLFTFSIVIGLLLSFLFFCLSWPIASYYGNYQLKPVCQLAALNFFLGIVNSVPSTLMTKHQRFKEMAICSFAMNLMAGPISIIAAYNGWGVYSLMIAPFLNAFVLFFYNRRFYPCNIDFKMSLSPVKRLASFSVYQMLFEIVNYFSRNLDKLIIGRWMSIADLGYYDKAYRLMQQPQNNITSVLTPVLQPNFRQYQDDLKMMSSQYLKVISLLATISFPLGVTLCFCGTEIIHIMYGSQWGTAIPCFQILCLSLPCAMLSSTTGSIYQASNATKHLFFVGLINSSGMIICFIIASYYFRTIEAIALAWTLFSVVGMLFTFFVMFNFVFKTNPMRVYTSLLKPVGNGIILALALGLLHHSTSLSSLASLSLKLTTAAFCTLIYMQLTGSLNVILQIKEGLKKHIR